LIISIAFCIITVVILTKVTPFTEDEIKRLRQQYNAYIKTVIDIDKKICSAGARMHFEEEKILLDQGSRQSSLWGGGIDLETLTIDTNSMINLRPNDNNRSNEIQDPEIRKRFEELSTLFFKALY